MSSCCKIPRGFSLLARCALLTIFLLVFFGAQALWTRAAGPSANSSPRLAVLLIFDQLRSDYLSRWQELFGGRGFRTLQQEGAWFTNCHYPYADTFTAPGHASVATGCSPSEHGIVGNNWYDRAAGKQVYCVAAGRYERVPAIVRAAPRSEPEPKKTDSSSVCPERLLAPTIGDALKAATGGKGRVVALSLKDRSAVLPAGQHPDACYWFDSRSGIFVSSSYYRLQLHPWVAEFNQSRPADRWFGKSWTRLRPDLEYSFYSGPDDVPAEGKGFGQGRIFPHPMMGGKTELGENYYQALTTSPYGNELLLELALHAIDAEHLGSGDAPDLLSVSFSSNDLIGHAWGPDSQEVLDVTLRTDRIVRRLLDHLDATVGKGRYVLALTADHGVCPIPEVARAKGKDAGRVSIDVLGARAEAFLNKTFGEGEGKNRWLQAKEIPWVYLNRSLLERRALDEAQVEEALAGWLKQQPGILTAYTRHELLANIAPTDTIGTSVRRSFYPERSGDVVAVLKPYHLFSNPLLTGTTHGTPHPYDTHVPLLVYGPGLRPGIHTEKVTPQAAATVLAHALGIPPPTRTQAPLPEGLFTSP